MEIHTEVAFVECLLCSGCEWSKTFEPIHGLSLHKAVISVDETVLVRPVSQDIGEHVTCRFYCDHGVCSDATADILSFSFSSGHGSFRDGNSSGPRHSGR